jgi:hypothetical protein
VKRIADLLLVEPGPNGEMQAGKGVHH